MIPSQIIPNLPRNKFLGRKRPSALAPRPVLPERKVLTPEDLLGLDETIRSRTKWLPKAFQMKAINGQLQQRDVVAQAPTGAGKSAILAGPHFHPSSKGKVTIGVSPLIGLQNEQVRNYHLKSP